MIVRSFVLGVFVCAACGPSSGFTGDDDDDGAAADSGPANGGADRIPVTPPNEFIDAGPQEFCDKMDILFVIDNSGSMAEEQENLAANFPLFIDVLDAFQTEIGSQIDYRVAVTSTGRDMSWTEELLPGFPFPASQTGENGALLQRCDMPRPWLERADPDVASTFACAAELGSSGANIEMPLYAVKLAFGDRIADGTNAGFLREDALLAIVILTDEDDCSREDDGFTLTGFQTPCDSLEPVAPYKQFLDDLTGAPGRWAVAVIAGPGPGECSSGFGSAQEAFRLQELVDMAGDTGVFSSICEGDLTGALEQALGTFETACEGFPPIP